MVRCIGSAVSLAGSPVKQRAYPGKQPHVLKTLWSFKHFLLIKLLEVVFPPRRGVCTTQKPRV